MPHPRKQKSHSSHQVLEPLQYSRVRGHPHGDTAPHVAVTCLCLHFNLIIRHNRLTHKDFYIKYLNLQCVLTFRQSTFHVVPYEKYQVSPSIVSLFSPIFLHNLKVSFTCQQVPMQHMPHVKEY